MVSEYLTDKDFILIVINGLWDEYESFIQNVTSCTDELSFKTVLQMLIDIDMQQRKWISSSPTTTAYANLIEYQKKDWKVIPCQICSKKGHTALNYYNRYWWGSIHLQYRTRNGSTPMHIAGRLLCSILLCTKLEALDLWTHAPFLCSRMNLVDCKCLKLAHHPLFIVFLGGQNGLFTTIGDPTTF